MFVNLIKNKNFINSICHIFVIAGLVLSCIFSCNFKNNQQNFNQDSQVNQITSDKFNSNYQNYNQKIVFTNKLNQTIANFNIAIADNAQKQATGLMYLKFLPENLGMLFIKDKPQIISMWMKNTAIPLDMIFLDKDFIITKIHHNAQPLSLKTISSNNESLAVLELNGGVAKKFQLKIGDSLIFKY